MLLAVLVAASPALAQPAPRPRIGVAFGGGSARGFAHVGVIRWFEEHHIPIDLAAGTSMGALIGGAYASGMTSKELLHMLADTDWDEMFGSSSYRYKNIRRKQDARAYPARLEFGLKEGLTLPAALNNGQQVDFLLARIVAPYFDITSFDELPTPFRCVAVDLRTSLPVVLDRGPLARALRATMSLPGVFPPIEADGRLLVDGGIMNNVPADVVRAMGADIVIAVNVGSMADSRSVSASLLGLVGGTVDSMMLANTRRGIAAADVIINPALKGFGSLDWRRAEALAEEGYQAAEALKDSLLKFAIDTEAWTRYVSAREQARRTRLPLVTGIEIEGATSRDELLIHKALARHLDQPFDVSTLEADLTQFAGFERYLTVNWALQPRGPDARLVIHARPKPYGPPFLMLSTNLQNTTSEDFSFQLAARYLTFDVLGAGTELRIDAAAGSMASVGAEFYVPIGASPFFAAAGGGVGQRRLNFVDENTIVAQYDQSRSFALLDGGVNIGRDDEVRIGVQAAYVDADPRVGDPNLPSLSGSDVSLRARWIHDTQNSAVVPSSGMRVVGIIRHTFNGPDPPPTIQTTRSNDGLTQAEVEGSRFWVVRRKRDRIFVVAGGGTSFDGHPLPAERYSTGLPFRLSAFDIGEQRGDHYLAMTGGYLRGIGRLPDFLGGAILAGAWIENGAAFDAWSSADLSTHVGVGGVLDTLLGPALIGASFGLDGHRRYYIGLGRVFP